MNGYSAHTALYYYTYRQEEAICKQQEKRKNKEK